MTAQQPSGGGEWDERLCELLIKLLHEDNGLVHGMVGLDEARVAITEAVLRLGLEVIGEDEHYTDVPLATDPYDEGRIGLQDKQRSALRKALEMEQ